MKRIAIAFLLSVFACGAAQAQSSTRPQAQAVATCGARSLTAGVYYPIAQDLTGTLCTGSGGGGGGTAVTIADGADVTQGAKADATCGTATGTCSEIALLKYLNAAVVDTTPVAVTISSGSTAVTQGTSPWVVSGTVTASGTVAATQSGTWTVQPGNTANTTPWLVTTVPSSSSSIGITPVVSAAAESSHVLKAGAGNVYSAYATNLTATVGFLVLINATAAPADGAITPLACVSLPANGPTSINYAPGPPGVFSTGIVAVVTSATTCFTKTTGVITAFISGSVQ